MKHLKLLFFILPFLIITQVHAKEYNMNSLTSATQNGTTNRYRATEIYNAGTSNTYSFGVRYTGRISDIETYFNYVFEKGTTYTLTYNMNTDDFRNNFGSSYWWDCAHSMTNTNATVQRPTYVNMKKVKFSFTPNEDTNCIRVWLRSSNISTTPFTGVSNWRLDSITIYDPYYQSGGSTGQGSSSTPTPTPTPTSNQDIINNANNNTQDIINNQRSNTDDIIDNNNSNTQDIINSNKENLNACYFNYLDIYLLGQNSSQYGEVTRYGTHNIRVTSTDSVHTDVSSTKTLSQIAPDLQIGQSYKFTFTASNSGNYVYLLGSRYLWNNGDEHVITQSDLDSVVLFYTSTPNSVGYYIDPMFQKSNSPQSTSYIPYGEYCINHLQNINNTINNSFGMVSGKFDLISSNIDSSTGAITGAVSGAQQGIINNQNTNQQQTNQKLDENKQAINEVNNSINNSNIDSGVGGDFFDDFQDNSHGLTAIITTPLTAIQTIASTRCQTLNVPIPFTNSSITLPCMTDIYNQTIPQVYNIWKIVSFGIISYFICIDIFHMVKGFKDPETDKVEVLDL